MRVLLVVLAMAAIVSARTLAAWDPNITPERVVPEVSAHRFARGLPATFTVQYDAATPATVKTAVEYVLNLLDGWLVFSTTAPIRVQFQWIALGQNVLGSATPNWVSGGSCQTQALYASLKGSYGAQNYDILAQFSSGANWYFGTDGNLAFSQYDFPTVFMHEIIHGLGFSSLFGPLYGYTLPLSELENYNVPNSLSSVYDVNVYYVLSGTNVYLSTVAAGNRDQAGLLSAAQSGTLYFMTKRGIALPLYSPSVFSPGSSLTHLSPTFFSGADSLMLPALYNGRAYHWPGLSTLYLLETVGYTLKNSVTATTQPPISTPRVTTVPPPPSPTPTVSRAPTTSPTVSPAPSTQSPVLTTKAALAVPQTTAPPTAPRTSAPTSPSATDVQTQVISAWSGSYTIDSSTCDPASCCCPSGSATLSFDATSNIVTMEFSTQGQCATSSASVRMAISSDSAQSGNLLWEGRTYTARLSGVPSVLSLSSADASCAVTARCVSGACTLAIFLSSSAVSLWPLAALLAALLSMLL